MSLSKVIFFFNISLISDVVLKSLRESFDTLPNDKSLDGIILTSQRDGIFTGGLDIFELYDTTEERFFILS